jgi:hypothetical protein
MRIPVTFGQTLHVLPFCTKTGGKMPVLRCPEKRRSSSPVRHRRNSEKLGHDAIADVEQH